MGRLIAAKVPGATHVFDVSDTIEVQIEATLQHRTMLANIVRQFALQAATAGVEVPHLAAARHGDFRPLIVALLRRSAAAKGAPYGFAQAETLRLSRFDFPL